MSTVLPNPAGVFPYFDSADAENLENLINSRPWHKGNMHLHLLKEKALGLVGGREGKCLHL